MALRTSSSKPARQPSFARRMILMLIGVAVIFGGVFAVKAIMGKATNDFFDNMPQPPVEVSTFEARSERWSGTAEAVGTLVADNGTDVTTEAGGVVQQIAFESGQAVRKGDLLVQLNTANEQAQLKALDTAARLAITQRDRWRELGDQKLVSRSEVDERIADAATTQAQADAQRALIAQKTIRAPFDGVLGIRQVNLGQYINPGDPIVGLQALDPIHVDFTLPEQRMNEVASFVKGGLQDLSISRTTFDWGVKVPGNPKHIMYVWVDALTNYITAAGYPDTDSEKFKRFWPADLHVIGKDIVRFHAVYWPAFLMSAGIAVPKRIFSHGFLFNRGEKMSKSVGNVIDPFTMSDTYGVDQFRYFFMREVPFGQDGNYSHEAIVNRINADLANDLGNLAQRSLSMIGKAFGGVLPEPGPFTEADKTILAAADAMIGAAREQMKTCGLHHILNTIWAVVADANRYFASEAPWGLAKTDPKRQGTILYVTAEVLRQVCILAQPFVPSSAGKMLDLLAVAPEERDFAALSARIAAGRTLPAPTPVFPRWIEPEAEGGPKPGDKPPKKQKPKS